MAIDIIYQAIGKSADEAKAFLLDFGLTTKVVSINGESILDAFSIDFDADPLKDVDGKRVNLELKDGLVSGVYRG